MEPVDCQPESNADISGIGVRVSFYVQTLLLSTLSARSDNLSEVESAMTTLVVTSLAYCVTTIVLSAKGMIRLYHAIVVAYLLGLAWAAICVTLAKFNRFARRTFFSQALAIFQNYFSLICSIVLWAVAPNFGGQDECNKTTKLFIFAPFSALPRGRSAALAILPIVFVAYTWILMEDFGLFERLGLKKKKTPQERPKQRDLEMNVRGHNPTPSETSLNTTRMKPETQALDIDGPLIMALFFIFVAWITMVVHVELLRKANNPQPGDEEWSFGQILPMFLVAGVVISNWKAFSEHGLRSRKSRRQKKQEKKRQRQRRQETNNSANRSQTSNP